MNFGDYAIGNFTVYPGTIMTIEPNHFEIWSVRPDGTDFRRSVVQFRFLVPEVPRTAKQSHYWDKNWDLLVKTVREEDWVVAKTISDGIAHGNVESVVYGRNEAANQHFHRQLSATCRRSGLAAANRYRRTDINPRSVGRVSYPSSMSLAT